MICKKCLLDKNNFYKGKNFCKDCISKYNKDRRKGVNVKVKKNTKYKNYSNLEVDINNYKDYFEDGGLDRVSKWIKDVIIKELNDKKA